MVLITQVLHAGPLLTAIEQVESGGDAYAVSKCGKAVGILQITQPCLSDVNRRYGLKWRLRQMRDPHLSRLVFHRYLELYATEERLGRSVTDEDRARIWNGGPDGWKEPETRGYWSRVNNVMKTLSR